MPLGPLEQLILHWLGYEGEPDQIYLGFFKDHLEAPRSTGYQDLSKDCYLAGVQLPSTQQFLELLQNLIDRGYAGAEVDDEEPVDDVRSLPKDVEPWDVSVYATAEGLLEIESIEEEMENEARTAEFVRRYLHEVVETLSFSAVIPPYILADKKALALVEVAAEESSLILTYTQGMTPVTTVTIFQTMGQLPEAEASGKLLSDRSQNLASVSVSFREYQVNVDIARIVAEWLKNDVSFRVTIQQENPRIDDYDWEPEALTINTAMRRRVFRIVRSCLSADSPESRVSTN